MRTLDSSIIGVGLPSSPSSSLGGSFLTPTQFAASSLLATLVGSLCPSSANPLLEVVVGGMCCISSSPSSILASVCSRNRSKSSVGKVEANFFRSCFSRRRLFNSKDRKQCTRCFNTVGWVGIDGSDVQPGGDVTLPSTPRNDLIASLSR